MTSAPILAWAVPYLKLINIVLCVSMLSVAGVTGYGLITEEEIVSLSYATMRTPPDVRPEALSPVIESIKQSLANPQQDMEENDSLTALAAYPLSLEVWYENRPFLTTFSTGGSIADMRRELQQHMDNNGRDNLSVYGMPEEVFTILHVYFDPKEYDPLSGNIKRAMDDFFIPGYHAVWVACKNRHYIAPVSRWVENQTETGWQFFTAALAQVGCDMLDFDAGNAVMAKFSAVQYVKPGAADDTEIWLSGDRVITPKEVTRGNLESFLRLAGEWFKHNLSEEGKLTYMYEPSYDLSSTANQLVRQWLCTRNLGEIAEYFDDAALKGLYRLNADYNIRHYNSKTPEGLTYVSYKNSGHLSPVSSAAHALLALPEYVDDYKDVFMEYVRTIQSRITDSTFNTMVYLERSPNARRHDRNFAAGVSFVPLAEANIRNIMQTDPETLKRLFHYYYDNYWKGNPNLYAAPWHMMGYAALYRSDPQDSYRDATFAVADYTVRCQGSDAGFSLDAGAFNYLDCRRASPAFIATGVRIEGLAHAYEVAKLSGDERRMKHYRYALLRGARHVLQGQIDRLNSYYMPNPQKAIGGVRTSQLDNTIRNDNTCHAASGIYKLLKVMDNIE